MTITAIEFKELYGFEVNPKANDRVLERLQRLITGEATGAEKAKTIQDFSHTSESWVRLFEDNNDPLYQKAIICDAMLSLWPKGYRPECPENQHRDNPIQKRFNAYLPSWKQENAQPSVAQMMIPLAHNALQQQQAPTQPPAAQAAVPRSIRKVLEF